MLIPWLLGIVGVLGVGGTIAAVIFFPAVAIPVLQSVVSSLLKCKPCLYALTLVALMSLSWWFGHHQAVLQCRESELAAELRNKQIDLENAHKAATDEAERTKSIEEQANARQKDDADYIAHLKNNPACALDDSDIGLPNNQQRPGSKKPAARAR